MTHPWLDDMIDRIAHGSAVRVVVIEAKGSTPREVGAAMVVTREDSTGTIGGGALELDAIEQARQLLASTDQPWRRCERIYHLGPALNQCCGGVVRLLFEQFGLAEKNALLVLSRQPGRGLVRSLQSGVPPSASDLCTCTGLLQLPGQPAAFYESVSRDATPLILYGAGHVGRAVVRALVDLPFDLTWVDIESERFPESQTPSVKRVVTVDPAGIASAAIVSTGLESSAWARAFHLVMTHSHTLDETIVTALLQHGQFGYLGLIGSATKRARFQQRLERAGLAPAMIARMACPIGIPALRGKAPAIIAASVVADLLLRRQALTNPSRPPAGADQSTLTAKASPLV